MPFSVLDSRPLGSCLGKPHTITWYGRTRIDLFAIQRGISKNISYITTHWKKQKIECRVVSWENMSMISKILHLQEWATVTNSCTRSKRYVFSKEPMVLLIILAESWVHLLVSPDASWDSKNCNLDPDNSQHPCFLKGHRNERYSIRSRERQSEWVFPILAGREDHILMMTQIGYWPKYDPGFCSKDPKNCHTKKEHIIHKWGLLSVHDLSLVQSP